MKRKIICFLALIAVLLGQNIALQAGIADAVNRVLEADQAIAEIKSNGKTYTAKAKVNAIKKLRRELADPSKDKKAIIQEVRRIQEEAEVWDCFPFFNELDILEIRLNILDEVVDHFVIIEASQTYSGIKKELYFQRYKDIFEKFAHKIIYVPIDYPKESELDERLDYYYQSNPTSTKSNKAWKYETYQRNVIADILKEKGCKDNDVVIISDLDEIPPPNIISNYKTTSSNKAKVLAVQFFKYFLNFKIIKQMRHDLPRGHGFGPYLARYHFLKSTEHSITKLRIRPHTRPFPSEIFNWGAGGWHFTSMGGARRYVSKLHSSSHAFDVYGTYSPATATMEDATDTLNDVTTQLTKHHLAYINITSEENFPNYVKENQERYKHLLYKATDEAHAPSFWEKFWEEFQFHDSEQGLSQ